MNRLDYQELMQEVKRELTMPGGNFEACFGKDEAMLRQAELIAAVALIAVDRFVSRASKRDFLLREADEHLPSESNKSLPR